MGTKLGIAKVKISKSGRHIYLKIFLKYPWDPGYTSLCFDILISSLRLLKKLWCFVFIPCEAFYWVGLSWKDHFSSTEAFYLHTFCTHRHHCLSYSLMLSCISICDVIKQNESELANTVFKIQPNKADRFFCFLLFVQSFNCLYLWNQLPNLSGVFTKSFHQNNTWKRYTSSPRYWYMSIGQYYTIFAFQYCELLNNTSTF